MVQKMALFKNSVLPAKLSNMKYFGSSFISVGSIMQQSLNYSGKAYIPPNPKTPFGNSFFC